MFGVRPVDENQIGRPNKKNAGETRGRKPFASAGAGSKNVTFPGKSVKGSRDDSKPKQRRALGDLSNTGNGLGGTGGRSGSKVSGKAPGASFAKQSNTKPFPSKHAVARPAVKLAPRAAKVELISKMNIMQEPEVSMGRMFEEEQALVQREMDKACAFAPLEHLDHLEFPSVSVNPGQRRKDMRPRGTGHGAGKGLTGSMDGGMRREVDRMHMTDMESVLGSGLGKGDEYNDYLKDDNSFEEPLSFDCADFNFNLAPLSPLAEDILSQDFQDIELSFK